MFEKEKPLNGGCDIFKLSHRRGSPQLMAQRAAVSGAILFTAYCSAAGSPDAEFSLTGTTRNRRNSPMLSPVDVDASVLTPVDHYVGLIPGMIMVSGSGPCHSP
jgi:hypothetical protein